MRRMLALSVLLSAGLAQAQQSITTPEALTALLQASGYTNIRQVERDGGVWEAHVHRADGSQGDIAVDPATGEIFDAVTAKTLLATGQLVAHLETTGYTDLTEMSRKGALWEVEARDVAGQAVELTVSGVDGRVLHTDLNPAN